MMASDNRGRSGAKRGQDANKRSGRPRSGSTNRSSTRSSGSSRSGDRTDRQHQGSRRGVSAPQTPKRADRAGWGSVAKHGAVGATIGQRVDEQEAEDRFSPDERARFEERQAKRAKKQERVDDLRAEARLAIDRSNAASPTIDKDDPKLRSTVVDRSPLPTRPIAMKDVPKELVKRHGKSKGAKLWQQFKRAAREFEGERFTESRRSLKPLMASDSDIAEVRELLGLCHYRLGHWNDAIEELETFRRLSLSAEQHPVLMDCHRALGNWADVDYLWGELGDCSPAAELMTEGRIVLSGAQADRGELAGAVRTLEKGWKLPKAPQEHHIRRAYALADLFERSGSVPRARKLFDWVEAHAPGYGNAGLRSEELV